LAHTVNFTGEQYGVPFAFSQDGKTFACALQPGGIRLYDPATWKPANEIKLSAHMDDYVRAIAFLPGGTTLILHHGRDQVERRDIGAEKPTWTIKEDMLALAVAPDGKRVAVSNAKGVSIRSAADGSEERLIPVTPDAESRVAYQVRADALAFSPDGSLLAMTRWDEGDVFVWDVATGSEYRRLVGHPVPDHTRIGETTVTFSADGRWLATGHADRTTRVWEVATGKEALRLIGHDATVSGASFSRDGRTLLTTGGVEVLLWDLRSGSTATTNLDTLWADLASDDAGKAYKAAATLSARDNVPEFLRGKLPPVAAVDPERVAKLVAELDSGRFAVREAAKKALADLGGAAQKALEAGLKKGPSAEGRARIEELLTRLVKPLAGTEAREARAVQALQWSGTAAARAVLKEWAAGAAGARLTEEAKRGVGVME
ncbi:MAG TPA: hypothetical protein VKE40_03160, partial [Gemmataceae bacterium]|nr:hypothetical protein [Gemmataceae bacterium]